MINENDARWLRDRFDAVVSMLSEAMATTEDHEPLDGATTAAFGAAIAYAEIGGRFGVLDRETAMGLLASYLDDDYWTRIGG
ncbi:MAG: hypothetical protein ACRDY6_06205 [Acidimicrobiia bacterium]